MKSFLMRLAVCVAVSVAALMGGTAQAAWMSQFSGHHELTNPNGSSDGVVNFAVWNNTDGDWTDGVGADATFGSDFLADLQDLSGGGIDAAAPFVYFYQVVNTNPVGGFDSTLGALFLPSFSAYSSFGVARDDPNDQSYVFQDITGDVDGSNPKLGNDSLTFETGVAPLGIGQRIDAGPNDYEAMLDVAPDMTTDVLKFSWSPLTTTGGFTSIMFTTSNAEPIFRDVWLKDGGFTEGVAAVATPAPGGLLLLLSGAPALLGLVACRRQRADAA